MNGEKSASSGCPLCQEQKIVSFMQVKAVPVQCNFFWSGRDAARKAPRGDIWLGFCLCCGHIFNFSFEPKLAGYVDSSESFLYPGPDFQAYSRSLAAELVCRYELYGKEAVEIGLTKGEFLAVLCELGGNRGTSFNAASLLRAKRQATGHTWMHDLFSEGSPTHKADFIFCRRILEYLSQPNELLATVRRIIGSRRQTAVLFEVPNVLFTLRRLAIWDISYEYFSYFSPRSLAQLVRQNGFELRTIAETLGGRFLTLEALPGSKAFALPDNKGEEQERTNLKDGLAAFSDQYWDKVGLWRRRLERFQARRQRVVIWGLDSRTVTFLNVLEAVEVISYVVDQSRRNEDRYIAGTAQRIVAPEHLASYHPHVVVTMNANSQREIRQQLQAMGLAASIMVAG
jgi:hypothetical protein